MAAPEPKGILQDITRRCDPRQRIQNASYRFQVSFDTFEARFNERIMFHVMKIVGKKLLLVIDESTRFSAARF